MTLCHALSGLPVLFIPTQGGARSSLALGWHVERLWRIRVQANGLEQASPGQRPGLPCRALIQP